MKRLPLYAVIFLLTSAAFAQQFNPNLYQEMRWRCIGPFRGGRTVAIAGIPDQPNIFYMAATDGGLWKTDDFGRTWNPIFDGQPSGSVGAMALAPSNPDIIYVGSGEGLRRPDLSTGDGLYKSTDAGKTWTHLGLRDGQQIGYIIVDPRDPNRLFVAVLGHPYGPNAERGVFRSTDGGQTFQKVLYKDENTGAIDLEFDPTNSQTIYAVMWASRRPPWSVGNPFESAGSGLFVSKDGGDHWRQLTGGLPDWEHDKLGRIGITIAPSNPRHMYALVDSPSKGGLYTSTDAGENWTRINTEERIWGRGSDFAWVRVSPKDENAIYVANTSTYKSTDGGKNFIAWKGAPGGDDYHSIWINPQNPNIILLGVDQGATITVNGGRTWSSWYNQPTAQFYHVITDGQFPYWVYGGQQESGSAGTASRGNDGEITFHDWHSVGAEEYAYIAPDPGDPNIIYGGPRGKVAHYHRDTGQVEDVTPVVMGKHPFNRTAPLIFSKADPHMLLLGSDVMFETKDGGGNWSVISPVLARPDPGTPANLGVFAASDPQKGKHHGVGVIYSIAPSPKDVNVIWAGTDDGVIQLTRDGGKSWQNATPPELTPWSKVAQLDAGHFDAQTAYAAVNRLRLDDLHPYIYRTHDGGKSWQKIVNGLPENAPVNTVREDPEKPGLLFAGTETSIWVSFDDGDHWQSLQLNLPATSMRDLVVHNDDLVVGTHGRSFWILDDITPLRQMTNQAAQADVFLFKPGVVYRYRRDTNTDTPLPPEEPAGKNPPDGAIIDYYLKNTVLNGVGGDVMGEHSWEEMRSIVEKAADDAFSIAVIDSHGNIVRKFPNWERPAPQPKDLHVPTYWERPLALPSNQPGMHRFVWDLHYSPPETLERDYPISAIYHDTPLAPQGPLALPGNYTVRLTVAGKTYTQPLSIKEDPRVKASQEDLEQQFALQQRIVAALHEDYTALEQLRTLRTQLMDARTHAKGRVLDSVNAMYKDAGEFESGGGPVAPQTGNLARLNGELAHVYAVIETADAAPTPAAIAGFNDLQQPLSAALAEWNVLKGRVEALNQQLKAAGMAAIDLTKPPPPAESGGGEDEP